MPMRPCGPTTKGSSVFTVPHSNLRNIGNALLDKDASWKYYGDQYNKYRGTLL